MEYQFRDWFACPACGERRRVSTLAKDTEIVFECHGCGLIADYVIGRDVSLQNLDIEAIKAVAEEAAQED